MGEIGTGEGTSYPGALDTDTLLESTSTLARKDVPNDLAVAIIAVQTEMGLDPAGDYDDVVSRLNAIDTNYLGTLKPADIITKGPWVDVRAYASINAAVTAIGSTKAILLVPSAQTLTANLTTPSTLTLKILQPGSIVKASTYTLTINGPLEAGPYQIFSGFSAGDVTFGSGIIKEVYPEWWGIDGTADETEINKALASGSGIVQLLANKTYNVSGTSGQIDLQANTWLRGRGWTTIINLAGQTASSKGIVQTEYTEAAKANVKVSDLKVVGNKSGKTDQWTAGIAFHGVDKGSIERVWVHDCMWYGIIVLYSTGGVSSKNVNVIDCVTSANYKSGINGAGWDGGEIRGNKCLNDSTQNTNLAGIFLEPDDAATIYSRNISIVGNYIDMTSSGAFGIYLENAATNDVDKYNNISIIGNTMVGNNTRVGIRSSDHFNVAISANTIKDFDTGIQDAASTATDILNVSITGNTITDCASYGIMVSSGAVITGNIVARNGCGIFIYRHHNVVSGNTVYNNGQGSFANPYGIYLDYATYNVITNNKAYDDQETKTQTYGIYEVTAGGSDYNLIAWNEVTNNLTAGIRSVGNNDVIAHNEGYATDLPIAHGGTGSSTAVTARTALGVPAIADVLGGDGTAGRIPRGILVGIDNGTNASTLKCSTIQKWNGDVIGLIDNIAKGATTGDFSLNAAGTVLTIKASGLSGNVLYCIGSLASNYSGTALIIQCTPSANDILIYIYNATTGAQEDMTVLVDTGIIYIAVFYITDA